MAKKTKSTKPSKMGPAKRPARWTIDADQLREELGALTAYARAASDTPPKQAAITCLPGVMLGKPCIAGTRVTVAAVLKRVAEGSSIAEIVADYPHLTTDNVRAALDYAAVVFGKMRAKNAA